MALRPNSSKTDEEKKQERKDAQDDVLMREIDDAVRSDQYADFAKKYGWPIVGVVVLGLLAFGGYLWWDSRNEAESEQQSEILVSGLDGIQSGNLDTASSSLTELAGSGDSGAAIQAQMLLGGIAMEQNRAADAARTFGNIAANPNAAPAIRDLALVREVAATYDQRKPEEIISKLQSLAVPGNAYFGSAGEMVAMAYLQQGKRKEAGVLFGEIAKDEDVAESLRSRARQMAGLLGVDAIEDVDEVLEDVQGTAQQNPPSARANPPAGAAPPAE